MAERRVEDTRWNRVEFCRAKIEGNKEKIEAEEAELRFLVHKRKSLDGQTGCAGSKRRTGG
eukprot:SAG11_NODE_3398_length_2469_cov_10.745992_2_plen_61_part_00